MSKLMDYLTMDKPTQPVKAVDISQAPTLKVEALDFSYLKPACDWCRDAEATHFYNERKLCCLHYTQLKCIESWDEMRIEGTREQEEGA